MTAHVAEFEEAAGERDLEAVAANLRSRNFEVVIVDGPEAARAEVMNRIPEGAQIHSGKSKTLEDIGAFAELMHDDRYDFVRKRTGKMDRRTQMDEIRKLGAAPDVMLGSVQAITQAGQLVVVSASGSQVGPYAAGAAKVVYVIGSQKIVPDLDTAMRRVREHVMPYEDARLREQLGVGTFISRILITEREAAPGRATVILVREPVGV